MDIAQDPAVKKRLTGGRSIARALVDNGVQHIFGIHGYINPVIEEACRLGVKMYHFRHEQSAGFAADAYGRIVRKPAVCFASASAGMANYLGALSQGKGALSPIVLLVGQHGTAGDHLDILQEGYAAECFKTVAKWTKRLTDWELNSYWVRKALVDSVTFPPGPVVLEIPLNNQFQFGDQPQRKYVPGSGLPLIPQTQGHPDNVAKAAGVLMKAKSPLLIAGDGVYWSDGAAEYQKLAERLQAPAGARRTARGAMPEDHPLAFSSSMRRSLFEKADAICLVGMRAGELDSWYEAPDWPSKARYIQIAETAEELWHGLDTEVSIVGSSKLVLSQLLEQMEASNWQPGEERAAWGKQLVQLRERQEARKSTLLKESSGRTPIHTRELAHAIAECLDPDATIIYDSYSGSLYLTDAIVARFPCQVLDAGPRVALGQGIGMALGATVARPGKQVITLVGDGGIGLSGMDVESLARYGLPAVIVVLNNSSWGGNALTRKDLQPDIGSWDMTPGLRYDRVFEPLGCHVEHVERSEDLRPALRRALGCGRVALVNVVADTDGTGVSAPWLRLKVGEYYSRGLGDLPPSVLNHFKGISSIEALRLHKTARDNGTNMEPEFLAGLTGRSVEELLAAAKELGYVLV